MIEPSEALEIVLSTAAPLLPAEVALENARGLALAEDIAADRDYPPFPRSMMDGFAVRLADAGRTVPIVGEVPAGSVWPGEIAAGQCVEILTGAPCPRGAEAVVPKEAARRQVDIVTLPDVLRPLQNIAPQGSDCRQGQRVLAMGQVVTSMAIGVLASFGRATVRVAPRPSLAIVTTGEELAPPGKAPGPAQIRNSNGPMLAAMAGEIGLVPPRQLAAADQLQATVQALEACGSTNLVVISGGVSVGTYDFVPRALAEIGAETIFHGVNQKPGRPILFARRGTQLIFGLPGNPLSCHFCFHRYVAAAARMMGGRAPACGSGRPSLFRGELVKGIEIKGGRVNYVPARAAADTGLASGWRVELLAGTSSADIFQGCGANCYVELPAAARVYEVGDTVAFTWLAGALP